VRAARREGVRTGLVSNSWGQERYDRASFPELFDAVVISGEVGLRKPEPEIYRYAAEQLDLAPEQCVFVDDMSHNVIGAQAVGMVAIHHTSYDETLRELQNLFGIDLG
jgi:putative hydrolase of the HAD superfamily